MPAGSYSIIALIQYSWVEFAGVAGVAGVNWHDLLGLNVMLLYDRERDLFVIAEFVVL